MENDFNSRRKGHRREEFQIACTRCLISSNIHGNIGRVDILDNRAENRKEPSAQFVHGRVANFVSDVPRTEIRGRCKIDLSPDLLPRTNKAGYRAWPAASSKRAIGAYPAASIRLVQIHTLQGLP